MVTLADLEKNGFLLQDIPVQDRSFEFCLSAVRQNGRALEYVPDNHKNSQICKAAVSNDGRALKFVTPQSCTWDICLTAVSNQGEALEFVPEIVHNMPNIDKIYDEAINNNGWALQYVPQDKRSVERCLKAILTYRDAIDFFPQNPVNPLSLRFQTCEQLFKKIDPLSILNKQYLFNIYNFCLAAVSKNGLALKFVSNTFQSDPTICVAAVTNQGRAIEFISKNLLTLEICETALKRLDPMDLPPSIKNLYSLKCFSQAAVLKNGLALMYVPDNIRSDMQLCLSSVSNCGLALEFVPDPISSDMQICLTSVRENGLALQFVPNNLRDINICLEAVSNNGLALEFVPDSIRSDRKVFLSAVIKNGLALQFVPNNLRDINISLAAISDNGLALQFVPHSIRIVKKVCLAAVINNGLALNFVPEYNHDIDICLAAISDNPLAVAFVSANVLTLQMCEQAFKRLDPMYLPPSLTQLYSLKCFSLAAVEKNGLALEFVPEDLRDKEICLTAILKSGHYTESVLRKIPLKHFDKKFLNVIRRVGHDDIFFNRLNYLFERDSEAAAGLLFTDAFTFQVKNNLNLDLDLHLDYFKANISRLNICGQRFQRYVQYPTIQNQPEWDLSRSKDLLEEWNDHLEVDEGMEWIDELEAADDMEQWWGMDRAAYYCPVTFFHASPHSRQYYGVHILERGVASWAKSLISSNLAPPEICYGLASLKLFAHELCHAWIEDLCYLINHTTTEIRPRYENTLQQYNSYIFMEEAICNTAAYSVLYNNLIINKNNHLVQINCHSVLQEFVSQMRASPRGYRNFVEIKCRSNPGNSSDFRCMIVLLLNKVYDYPRTMQTKYGFKINLEDIIDYYFKKISTKRYPQIYIHQ